MNVAVIGTGRVGIAVGGALAKAGKTVVFGSRSPGAAVEVANSTAVTVTGVRDAIAGADVVVVAVPGGAVADLARQHGAALAGKLVVDATNNLGGGGPAHSAAAFSEHAPDARYARAFNTLGWENFAEPGFHGVRADLFFSSGPGDRAVMEELIGAVGLRPIYLGPDQQDTLDGVMRLWFTLAVGQGRGRHLAFKVLDDTGF
jgi:8-hydroxy-5-deazaflavin:NADPH oxidoreductase